MENNKSIIQSTRYTTLRNNFGIYTQRLLVLLAEAMQYRYENADLKNGIIKDSEMELQWTFKIADLNMGNGNNYQYIKDQLYKSTQSVVRYEKDTKTTVFAPLFMEVEMNKDSGEIKLKLNPSLWFVFVELSKGYKRYQLATAMQFSSAYALRLYQLLSGNKEPITYSVEYLKEMFAMENAYTNPADFIKYAIEKPIKEINEKAEYNVSYEILREKVGKGRPKINALRFILNYKARQSEIVNKDIMRKYGFSLVPNEIRHKLMEMYDFTEQGIKANAQLIAKAYATIKNFSQWLDKKRKSAMKVNNPQGWIINAMNNEIQQFRERG